MLATFRTVMSRAIDYAGVYPPARLPLAEAVAEYARLRGTPGAWMLARFVCPAGAIAQLAELWPAGDDLPLVVAAIGAGGDRVEEFLGRTEEDVAAIAAACAGSRRVIVDQFEVKLPPALLAGADATAVAAAIGGLLDALTRGLPPSFLLAVEAPLAGAPAAAVRLAVDGIAACNRAAAGRGRTPVCLKVRCGGLAAAAIPSPAELAAAIAACRAQGVAIKATQGLHHPFRRYDPTLGADTHGFVNLIVAAALAVAGGVGTAEIEAALGDTDPAHFEFTDEVLAWGRHRLTIAHLAAGRRHGVLSFGSCSFAEPRDDLAALGLMTQ